MMMDQETKLKLLKQVIIISAAFCILVAFLLIVNFLQMKNSKPLESQTVEALVKRLAEENNNDELRQEIRQFDLLARKAYFTSEWQVNTGAYLLLFGGVVLALALKIRTDIRTKIGIPENPSGDSLKDKYISHRWLFATGILVFAFALLSSFLSVDYLKNYSPGQFIDAKVSTKTDSIEIIPIVEIVTAGKTDSVVVSGAESSIQNEISKSGDSEKVNSSVKAASVEDFKKNQSTFRGFMGQGISYHKNIPTDWDGASGVNIKWKITLTKPGYNTPVIWGDKIFVAGGDNVSRIVSCFNRNTGRLLWEKEAGNIPGSPASPPKTTDDTGLAAPTMTIDGKMVFALFGTGDLIAFDLDGNLIWAKNLGVPTNHYGHSSSLLTWNGKLIVQYDTSKGGRMIAINNTNGEFVWDISRSNKISWSSPVLYQSKGKMQVITSADPNVSAYDIETGAELWKSAVMSGEVAPSPAIYNGLVFASNEYAKTVALDAENGGKIVWETDEYLSEVSSPVAANSLLFLATSYGVLVCYDALTGEKIWEKEFNSGFYSSPMIAENKVYIIDMSGIMHIINADRTGTIIKQPELGEAAFALPVFADGRIYLRGKSSLYCIGK